MDVHSLNPPHLAEADRNATPVRGDYAAGERGGEENPRRWTGSGLPSSIDRGYSILVMSGGIRCSGQQQCSWDGTTALRDPPRSASMLPMTAGRSILRGAGSASFRILHICPFQMGGLF